MFTSMLECRSQREEIRSEETKVSVLHVIPYDRDQPAAWELQVITGEKESTHSQLNHYNDIQATPQCFCVHVICTYS